MNNARHVDYGYARGHNQSRYHPNSNTFTRQPHQAASHELNGCYGQIIQHTANEPFYQEEIYIPQASHNHYNDYMEPTPNQRINLTNITNQEERQYRQSISNHLPLQALNPKMLSNGGTASPSSLNYLRLQTVTNVFCYHSC
jgi:hypothetical protein